MARRRQVQSNEGKAWHAARMRRLSHSQERSASLSHHMLPCLMRVVLLRVQRKLLQETEIRRVQTSYEVGMAGNGSRSDQASVASMRSGHCCEGGWGVVGSRFCMIATPFFIDMLNAQIKELPNTKALIEHNARAALFAPHPWLFRPDSNLGYPPHP